MSAQTSAKSPGSPTPIDMSSSPQSSPSGSSKLLPAQDFKAWIYRLIEYENPDDPIDDDIAAAQVRVAAWIRSGTLDSAFYERLSKRLCEITKSVSALITSLEPEVRLAFLPYTPEDLDRVSERDFISALERHNRASTTPKDVYELLGTVYSSVYANSRQQGDRTDIEVLQLQNAFVSDYQGKAAELLNKKLLELKHVDGKRVYANIVPIIQSSGTGKTRTAIQLCTLQLGLYLNIRGKTDDIYTTSLPPQDLDAFRALVPDTTSLSESVHRRTLCCWLVAFAEEFLRFCEKEAEQLTGSKKISKTKWSEFITHINQVLYTDLVPGFRLDTARGTSRSRTQSSESNSSLHPRTQLIKTIRDKQLEKLKPSSGIAESLDLVQAKHLVHASFLELQKFLPKRKWYCFLVIDEAISMGKERLRILRQLLSETEHFASFRVLILDTNNKVAELTGFPRIGDPPASGRLTRGLAKLAQPFVNLPHDVFLMDGSHNYDAYCQRLIGAKETTHLDWMKMLRLMGRPLWNDGYYHSGQTEEPDCLTILDKLIGWLNRRKGIVALPREVVMAMASQRLPLNIVGFQGCQAVASFLTGQVSQYLRTIIEVESTGKWISSWNPSEPLLSMAVANHFRKDPDAMWTKVVSDVTDTLVQNQLTLGENGEELVRILLSYANDRAAWAASRNSASGSAQVPFVRVSDVFEQLFGAGATMKCTEQAAEWAETHWINFTHFCRLPRQVVEYDASDDLCLAQAWSRQAALLGVDNQHSVDFFIPAYYSQTEPQLNNIWKLEHVDVLTGQVKNRISVPRIAEEAKIDRSALFVPVRQSSAERFRGFNLYISLATKPKPNEDTSDDSILGFLIQGSSFIQFPIMKHLDDWKEGEEHSFSLPLLLGRRDTSIRPFRYDTADHNETHQRGNYFEIRRTGIPSSLFSGTKSDTAETEGESGKERKANMSGHEDVDTVLGAETHAENLEPEGKRASVPLMAGEEDGADLIGEAGGQATGTSS